MEIVRVTERKHRLEKGVFVVAGNILTVTILAFNARMTLRGINIIGGFHGNFDNETNTVRQQAKFNKGVVNVLYIEKLID